MTAKRRKPKVRAPRPKIGRAIKTLLRDGPFAYQAWMHHELGASLEFTVVTFEKNRSGGPERHWWRGRYVGGRWIDMSAANDEGKWVEQQFKEERTA